MTYPLTRKTIGGAFLLACSLMLSACFLSPGKFTSNLDIRKDGHFRFSYAGEIYLLTLTDIVKNSQNKDSVFEPEPCQVSSGVTRECTATEIDKQMREWETEQKAQADKKKQEAEQMAAMLGGFDPSDPKAAEELVSSLRRQAGWRKVEYTGNGRFDVDFTIDGQLDHDFLFPTMERFPMANAFVQLTVQDEGRIRVEAPGFSAASLGAPFQSMAQMAMFDAKTKGEKDTPEIPLLDGVFTLTTDGDILANNTDLGPQSAGPAQKLEWTINSRAPAAPTALIRLSR